MAITESELKRMRELFDNSVRPVICFDDDPDGFSSFLLIYKHIKEGRGLPIKNALSMGEDMAKKIRDYEPDLVVFLDIPVLQQEFIDMLSGLTIAWVDHHPPQNLRGVEYFNPRKHDDKDNRPTTYWIYRAVQENIWIAMTGMTGDWFIPEKEILDQFRKEYPGYFPENVTKPEVALHDTQIGELARIFSFNMKGKVVDVVKSAKVMTRVNSPDEIMEQTSAGGKFIYGKYRKLKDEYDSILKSIKVDPKDPLLLFVYKSMQLSFSSELSNELIYRHPDKIVIVAWEYEGEYKCSLRSTKGHLPSMIEQSLKGLTGYGGGHDHASGACIKSEDFEHFVENFRKLL